LEDAASDQVVARGFFLMETADDGVDFSASNARDWEFQLIGGFKKMCDGFFFQEVFRGVGLKDFR
jgi:hypothetical protein